MRLSPTVVGAILVTLVLTGLALEAAWRTNPLTNAPARTASTSPETSASVQAVQPKPLEFTPVVPAGGDIRAVTVSDDKVIAGDKSQGVFVIDGSTSYPPTSIPGEPVSIDVSGGRAAVSAAWGGLVLLDISEPSQLKALDIWPTTALTKDAAFFGDHLLVADWNDGVHVLRIAEDGSLTEVGALATKGHAVGVAVSGDIGFVADFEGGLLVIALDDPARPRLLGSFRTLAATSVAASGTTAYVCDEQRGFLVLDAADPQALVEQGRFPVGGQAHALAFDGTLATVGDMQGGTWVLDVSSETSPTLIATATLDPAHSLAMDARRIFHAGGALKSAPRPAGVDR